MNETIEQLQARIEQVKDAIRSIDPDTSVDQIWSWYEELDCLYEKLWELSRQPETVK